MKMDPSPGAVHIFGDAEKESKKKISSPPQRGVPKTAVKSERSFTQQPIRGRISTDAEQKPGAKDAAQPSTKRALLDGGSTNIQIVHRCRASAFQVLHRGRSQKRNCKYLPVFLAALVLHILASPISKTGIRFLFSRGRTNSTAETYRSKFATFFHSHANSISQQYGGHTRATR
eukprot:GEMP01057352.1.p1 GENE.GEMP01057352.1~~GEMP01057352.1.p1  ORF type:complete len:174 (-),score=20.47 GEMP01057352.1:100-621(-)